MVSVSVALVAPAATFWRNLQGTKARCEFQRGDYELITALSGRHRQQVLHPSPCLPVTRMAALTRQFQVLLVDSIKIYRGSWDTPTPAKAVTHTGSWVHSGGLSWAANRIAWSCGSIAPRAGSHSPPLGESTQAESLIEMGDSEFPISTLQWIIGGQGLSDATLAPQPHLVLIPSASPGCQGSERVQSQSLQSSVRLALSLQIMLCVRSALGR